MPTPRIYTPQPLQLTDNPNNNIITLDDDASNHLLRVLRHKEGDMLILFNGQGGEYRATLEGKQGKKALVSLQSYDDIQRESTVSIELAPVLLSGARMDFIIQKAVELGAAKIQPILSQRAEGKIPQDRLESRLTHWKKVIISACEQCGRNQLPAIHAPTPLNEWLHNVQSDVRLVGDPRGQALSTTMATSAVTSMSILVGPEGGFTDEEIALTTQFDFQSVAFGPRVLRAETAAMSLLTLAQGIWGDLLK